MGKIFVTGNVGIIRSYVQDWLTGRGFEAVLLSDLFTDWASNLGSESREKEQAV